MKPEGDILEEIKRIEHVNALLLCQLDEVGGYDDFYPGYCNSDEDRDREHVYYLMAKNKAMIFTLKWVLEN